MLSCPIAKEGVCFMMLLGSWLSKKLGGESGLTYFLRGKVFCIGGD